MVSPQASNQDVIKGDGAKSDPKNLLAKRMLTAVNFFVETNRLEPYTAVYLIQVAGWNEVHFGVVSLAMNNAMLIFQTPAGDLLDKTKKWKKIITAVAIVIAAFTTTMVVWTTNFWAILIGKTVEGICATIFLPALMALILGICETDSEVPSFIATTEVSNKIGSFVIVLACAVISWTAFPNVDAMFYLLGAGGLAAAAFTLAIPESSLDHDRARQLEERGDDDKSEERDVEEELSSGTDDEADGKKATPSRYCDLLRNRSVLLFAFLTFMYHLANAAIVPLLAQYVAIISTERSRLAWTSAILMIFFFSQAITAHAMSFAVDRFDHKRIMIVAFVLLPVRCALISSMIIYWSNPWALIATQIIDGLAAGIYDIMLPIVVKKLTKGSGRFGFTFGFTITCWRIGHGLSVFLSEMVVHELGYAAAFLYLGCVGILNLLGFALFFSFDDSTSAAEDNKPTADNDPLGVNEIIMSLDTALSDKCDKSDKVLRESQDNSNNLLK